VKVKALPSDFIVHEESSLVLRRERSEYAVFRLSKTSWDTFDLLDLLARTWGLTRQDISVGGMKDRHGSTEQLISVRSPHGTPRPLSQKNFSLDFQGWSSTPVTARDVVGNRFEITVRDLTERETNLIVGNAPVAARDGFPNYFDEQRFGSARHGAGFMGKEIFLGHREKALRLYFTPSKHDDQKTRKLKKCVIDNWGHWDRCSAMGFGEYGRLLAYLSENRLGYHQALEKIDRRFLVFVLNAYQSFLFNEVLGRWLALEAGDVPLLSLRYAFGEYRFFPSLPPAMAQRLRAAQLPVPGYDTLCDDPAVRTILESVLVEEGITLSDLRVRNMHRIHVGGVPRAAVVVPEDLSVSTPEPDELSPGKRKMLLRFFLARGSYATILLKRLTLPQ